METLEINLSYLQEVFTVRCAELSIFRTKVAKFLSRVVAKKK